MKTRKPGWPIPTSPSSLATGANTERGERLPVINSVFDETIGEVPKASRSDLDRAVAAGEAGFAQWNKVTLLGREKT
jgi:acyl-CoA reductase-like NAD-dependent aldehyde dehydrogenase